MTTNRRVRAGKNRRRPKPDPAQASRPIRVCYADPVYPGRSSLYSVPGTPEYHPDAARWDDPAEHVRLMARLEADFPDGWALSTTADALPLILPGAPAGSRVAAWCRGGPRLNLRVVPGWEAVILRTRVGVEPGRPKTADWLVCGIGHTSDTPVFYGAKPTRFSRWVFALLGLGGHPDDELVDLFPGSGAVTRAWDDYRALAVERRGVTQGALFGSSS